MKHVVRGLVIVAIAAYANLAYAGCYNLKQQLPKETVGRFLESPAEWLKQFPAGGMRLIAQVRDLVASDAATLPAVVGLLAVANDNQKSAIGSGLGQAARICGALDQAGLGAQIRRAVSEAEGNNVKAAFRACAGSPSRACYDPERRLPVNVIEQFANDPERILRESAGDQLRARVRDLAASDPAVLSSLIGLLRKATGDQQSAIGSGLAEAARICAVRDPAFAKQAQREIDKSDSASASKAFAAAGAAGTCYAPPRRLSAQAVNRFLCNPGQAAQPYGEDGAELTARIRDLVASDLAALPSVTNLLNRVSKDQQSAIGSALAQAARICAMRDQAAAAAQIERAVNASQSKEASRAFEAGGSPVCLPVEQRLSAEKVGELLADPGKLLSRFPHGGPELITQVRDLLASDPVALSAVQSLWTRANKEQEADIRIALAQAARICAIRDQTYAKQILQTAADLETKKKDAAYFLVGNAACLDPLHQVRPAVIKRFLSDPGQLLSEFPSGGTPLAARIRNMFASDSATLPAILDLAMGATKDQRSAISNGLAQAAQICKSRDREVGNAACYGPSQRLPADAVKDFLDDPNRLLKRFPNGEAPLVAQVRDLVASDSATLLAVLALMGDANADQQSAIGNGLGQAARACASQNQASVDNVRACYAPQQRLPSDQITSLLCNPAELLNQFPDGGPEMVAQVRDLIASDTSTLPALVSLFGCATSDQLSAIGTGLAQAAQICTARDQEFATQIQRTIVAADSDELNAAYTAGTQEVSIGRVATPGTGIPGSPGDPGDPSGPGGPGGGNPPGGGGSVSAF